MKRTVIVTGRLALMAALSGRLDDAETECRGLRGAYARKVLVDFERSDEDLYRGLLGPFDDEPDRLFDTERGHEYIARANSYFGDVVPRLRRLAA